MKKFVFLLFILACSQAFQLQIQQTTPPKSQVNLPKLPAFIGMGYDLLQGNPFTNHVDQGFKAPIFQFAYEKGQTTQDGKYLIPDFTHSVQTTSCSLESKVTQFTGTQNYQKYLSSITKFDSRLSLSFLKAAFSFSNAFEQFSNSTQSHNQTSSQTNAECTVYTAQMPLYSNQIQLSIDFVQGVKYASKVNDWEQFIDHFGTHYASLVVYGGRYFLEHTYSQESMSLFESLKLDINIAAKIQYLEKIGVQLSQDLKQYSNKSKVISSKVSATRLSTIGGQPPKSGNWMDWANTVKDNLAPVSYHLVTLSVLFNFIHDIDTPTAIKSYESYLNTLCQKKQCKPLTPQRPNPKPLAISFLKTSQVKGQNPGPRAFDSNDGLIKVGMRISRVLIGTQGCIDSIQFFLTDGLEEHILPRFGKPMNFNKDYLVPKNDQIQCVRFGIIYASGQFRFESLQFITRKGVQSPIYNAGHTPNQYRSLCVSNSDQHLVGFYGHMDDTISALGFNIMKEVVQK